MISLRSTVVAASLVLAFGVLACGSSDEDSGADPAAAPQSQVTSGDAAPATPTPNPSQAASSPVIAFARAVPRVSDFDTSITGEEAVDQGGKTVKVCGKVVEILPDRVREHIWVFNFDKPSPNETFVIHVGKDQQRRHGTWPPSPETFYVGKDLCVAGRVELRDGTPFIIIHHSDQVELIE